jgi:hypothetical protein
MPTVKKIIISSIVGGVSIAVTIAIIFVIISWYENRPKPWNKDAISATYDYIETEGEKNYFVCYYTLQNNTDYDYKFSDLTDILIMSKLKKQKSLSGNKESDTLKPDYPIIIPAKQRIRFAIHLQYPYDKTLKEDASKEERKAYRKDIEAFFNNKLQNLDGFVLFDERARYQIEFPKGW